MLKRLFLFCGIMSFGLVSCASQPKTGRYADSSCEALRAILISNERNPIPVYTPQGLGGINKEDRKRIEDSILGSQTKAAKNRDRERQRDLAAIRAAYKVNNCDAGA